MSKTTLESLLVDSSRAVADLVVSHIGTNPVCFRELYEIALEERGQISMRAARALDLCDEAFPGMASTFIGDIYHRIKIIKHQSVLRCFQRLLVRYPLPENEEELVELLDLSIHWATDEKYPVAVRYYGLFNLQRLCEMEPDLRFEVIPIMELTMEGATPALKYRIREIIKKLHLKTLSGDE